MNDQIPPLEDPRSLLAAERTLLAWLRTGVSLITFGFAIARLGEWVPGSHPSDAQRRSAVLLGGLLVLLGAVAEVVGLRRFLAMRRALIARQPIPLGAGEVIAAATVTAALGLSLGIYVFF